MVQHFLFILAKLKLFQDEFITLSKLGSCELCRNACLFGMVLDQVHYAMETSMYRAVFFGTAKVHSAGTLLESGHMKGVAYKFFDTFVSRRRDRHYRDTQHFFHLVDMDSSAVFFDFIHHVECQHHRHIQLHQLHGEIKISFYICSIDDVDYSFDVSIHNEFSRNDFFAAVRRHGIYAGKVSYQRIGMTLDNAVFSVHSNAREVPYMLIGACKLIEQSSLAAILVSGKRKGQCFSFGNGVFISLNVILAPFSKTRMIYVLVFLGFCFDFFCSPHIVYRDLLCIRKP